MENKTQIPSEYTPFDEIILCGNKLIKVKKIVDDKGFIPILIGENKKNRKPQIWLNAKTTDGTIKLIDKNKPLINLIEFNEYSNENQIDIILNNEGEKHIILQIENVGEVPSITKFDLRTIGYNIFGDENELNIGGNKMINNSFQAETLIGV